jgi:hypothetical protein
MFKRLKLSLGLGAAALALSRPAMAYVGVNIGIPAPVYAAPAPVYAPPAAVYGPAVVPGLAIGWPSSPVGYRSLRSRHLGAIPLVFRPRPLQIHIHVATLAPA